MLRGLLYKTDFTGLYRFRAIVYVDDKVKYVKHIFHAFCQQPVDLRLFHYTHEAERVKNFKNSSKLTVISKWKKNTGDT